MKKKRKLTPAEMGQKSWAARVKKYGKKGATQILKKASIKSHSLKKKVIHS